MTNNLTDRKGNKLQVTGNLVTGDTYPVKDFLKAYCAAKWDKDAKGWRVDASKLSEIVSRGNHIGLRIDDTVADTGKATCWGDCQA